MRSSLLFLLCVHVNAPFFGSLTRRSAGYQVLSGGESKRDFDSVVRSESTLPPLLHERGAGMPVVAKSQNSDETLEFVRCEFYNANCKINAKQHYSIIFNLNARFIERIDFVQISELKILTGWILNEYENIGKLSNFLNIRTHILRRFALDILINRINCGCEKSFNLFCSYMSNCSRSVIKEVSIFSDSKIDDETQISRLQDIKSKVSELWKICNGTKWKQQSYLGMKEKLLQNCCSEQNLSSRSKNFWNNVVKNSLWVDRKEFEDLPVCIRLILTDEAGEADKLKRLEEFAGCTFRADERLPLNFSETLWSVLSREEE